MFCRRFVLPSLIPCLMFAEPLLADDDDGEENAHPFNDYFMSDSLLPQEKGETQLSLLADFTRFKDDSQLTAITTGMEYGISDSFQVEIVYTPSLSFKPQSGARQSSQGDASLGFMQSWMHIGGSANSVAINVEHRFANPDGVAVGDGADPVDSNEIALSVARNLDGSRGMVSLQLGMEMSAEGDESFYNLAGYHTLGPLVLSGEYNWSSEESWVTPGVFWKPSPVMFVGLGTAIGVGDNEAQSWLLRVSYDIE